MSDPHAAELLAKLVTFVGPLGPFGDLDFLMRGEREWIARLTEADVLLLLQWVTRGAPLDGLDLPARFREEAIDLALSVADEVAERDENQTIRHALTKLESNR